MSESSLIASANITDMNRSFARVRARDVAVVIGNLG